MCILVNIYEFIVFMYIRKDKQLLITKIIIQWLHGLLTQLSE